MTLRQFNNFKESILQKKSKSILITGASSGIGKACTIYLAENNYVVYAGVRKETDKEKLLDEGINNIIPVTLDVTNQDHIQHVFNTINQNDSLKLYGIINNAGIAIGGVLEETNIEDLRHLLEVNVIGLHAVTKTFLPLIRKNKGRILNIGSPAGFYTGPCRGAYAASKYAVRALTETLRLELLPLGVRVSHIIPDGINTAINDKITSQIEEYQNRRTKDISDAYKTYMRSDSQLRTKSTLTSLDVAKTVYRALNSRRPKSQYFISENVKNIYKRALLSKRDF